MIHNDVLNQLQLLIKTSAPPLIEVAQSPLEEAQWVPGQRLTATVLASMPNGRFQVLVGDMALDMNLPRNTQPGEQVELTFISSQPRLTFALTRDLLAAAGSNLPADAKPRVTLSDSVRYLGALLQKISDQAESQAAPVSKAAPLLSTAPTDIKEFAASLRNTLSQSGLFYESHQAQWVAGERKLADLLQEPQGRLSTASLTNAGLTTASLTNAGLTNADMTRPTLPVAGSGTSPTIPLSANSLPPPGQSAATEPELEISPRILQPDKVLMNPGPASMPGSNPGISPNSPQLEKALSAYAQIAMVRANSANPSAILPPDAAHPARPNQAEAADSGFRATPNAQQAGQAPSAPQATAPEPGAKIPAMSLQNEGSLMQGASRLPVHTETVSLVQQQLQTLDSRQLVWQGQVWQGQMMEWRVEERGAREGGAGEVEMPHWQTSLRLQLPKLGDVQATLAFTPQGLRIDLKASDSETAETMRGAQGKLRNSMEASGLNVLAMSVERHEKI